jgi:hypothetical protein
LGKAGVGVCSSEEDGFVLGSLRGVTEEEGTGVDISLCRSN